MVSDIKQRAIRADRRVERARWLRNHCDLGIGHGVYHVDRMLCMLIIEYSNVQYATVVGEREELRWAGRDRDGRSHLIDGGVHYGDDLGVAVSDVGMPTVGGNGDEAGCLPYRDGGARRGYRNLWSDAGHRRGRRLGRGH